MTKVNVEKRKEVTRKITDNVLEKIFVTDESLFFQLFEEVGELNYYLYEEHSGEIKKIIKDEIKELLEIGNKWDTNTEKAKWELWFNTIGNSVLIKRIPKQSHKITEWYLMSPVAVIEIPISVIYEIEDEIGKEIDLD